MDRFSFFVHSDEYDDAVGFLLEGFFFDVSGIDVDGDVHTGSSSVNNVRFQLYNFTNFDWLIKSDSANVNGDAIAG
ncbi:hypothetical protein D3C86_2136320 [compost metagenome]